VIKILDLERAIFEIFPSLNADDYNSIIQATFKDKDLAFTNEFPCIKTENLDDDEERIMQVIKDGL
jgi:hypothetical protein